MIPTTARPYRPSGPLALDPVAWGMMWEPPAPPKVDVQGGVAVVSVRGPLVHHEDPWCDSYDAIKARVLEAVAGSPRAVLLSVDSPGGVVSGLFDTAREIRTICEKAGIPLVGYVDGAALSAAYALVSTCERVYAPPTASIGSIGVVAQLVDLTAADAERGIAFRFAYSGARKVDGNPHAGVSEAALASAQSQVDYLAGLFFEHVAVHRAQTADEVKRLEAATLIGSQALRAGLVDEVVTGLDQVIAAAAAAEETRTMDPKDQKKTATPSAAPVAAATPAAATAGTKAEEKEYEEAIAALRRRAAAGDARAKRMLKAELDDDGDEKPEDKPGAETKPEDKPAAETKPEDKPEDKDAKALAARVDAIDAQLKADAKAAEDRERATLLASRPDLDDATRKLLASAPIADVRLWCTTAPKRAVKPVAGAPQFTAPEGVRGSVDHLPPEEARALDVQMGLASASAPPFVDGTRQVLPVLTRQGARDELARRDAAAKAEAAKGGAR